jgi:hypothetical protein
MNESTLSEALDAVHDVAVGLLKYYLDERVQEGLQLIISIARHKHDVRAVGEGGKTDPEDDRVELGD